MLRLLALWLIHTIALLGVAYVMPSVHVASFATALAAAAVLGLANTVVRPILVVLTLPVTIITLGLFLLYSLPSFWVGSILILAFDYIMTEMFFAR